MTTITGYFTLTEVRDGGVVPNPPGGENSTLQRWYADFAGADGAAFKDAYWLRQPGSATEVGQSYYGEMEQNKKGYRFRSKTPPPDAQAPANVSPSGNGGVPQQQAAGSKDLKIQRQHSQEMALRVVELVGVPKGLDLNDAEDMAAFLNGPVRKLTDFFQRDITRAPQVPGSRPAPQGVDDTAPQQAAEAGDLPPDHDPDDDIPF